MGRCFSESNHYNIVGFCNEFQEHVRIVRYLPENRLVCIICRIGGGFWNHPDDIPEKSKYVPVPREREDQSKLIGLTVIRQPFGVVSLLREISVHFFNR